ncbi:MAG: DUF3048 domain-containing protein [Clostridiales bacterium]|nr:DUF3048 domain-containing protein [Clostridiales bacterium]
MKRYLGVILILLAILVLGGCNKGSKDEGAFVTEDSSEATQEVTEESLEETQVETEENIPVGYVKSRLTGLHIPEEIGSKRPYALMISNIKEVNPQSGISQASVIYEALVEGGITRMMGLFEDFDSDRIGSIRSGRQYFASIADSYDAIFVSFGESSYCTEKIAELGLNQLSGLKGEGTTVFYRDKSLKAPHNAFASKDGIIKGTERKKFKTDFDDSFDKNFTFSSKEFDLESEKTVDKLTLKFSSYQSPYFTYDSDYKLYKRFQFGGEHIDANNDNQLEFKNIIIQLVDGFSIDETRSFSFRKASGQGYYISNGKAVPITWDKDEQSRSMVYYGQDGKILEMNPGKTYIAVLPADQEADIVFE